MELLAELRPLASRVQPGRVDASRAGISTGDIQQARHATRPRNPFDKPELTAEERVVWVDKETRAVLVAPGAGLAAADRPPLRPLLGRLDVEGMRPQPDGRIVVPLGDNTALVLDAATGRVLGRPRTSLLDAPLHVGIHPGSPPAVAWACWEDTPHDLEDEGEEEDEEA